MAFIRADNSVAKGGLRIRFIEPESTDGSAFLDLRTAALEGDVACMHESLDAIRSGRAPLLDFEVEGHVLHNTGHILLEQGFLDLAEEAFQALIALDPQIAAGYVGLGHVCAQQGDISAATKTYERAMELDARYQWLAVVIADLDSAQEQRVLGLVG
jgi:tetratricopeptide (TPR) repeat protein